MTSTLIVFVAAVSLGGGVLTGHAFGTHVGPLAVIALNVSLIAAPMALLVYARRQDTAWLWFVSVNCLLFALAFTFTSHCEAFARSGTLSIRLLQIVTGLSWSVVILIGSAAVFTGRWVPDRMLLILGAQPLLLLAIGMTGVVLSFRGLFGILIPLPVLIVLLTAALVTSELAFGNLFVATIRRTQEPVPETVRNAVSRLRNELNVAVDGPIYSPAVAPAGIHYRLWGPPVLILNSRRVGTMPGGALSAVIAHEFAHVRRRHVPRVLGAGIAVNGALAACFAAFNEWLPTPSGIGGIQIGIVFVVVLMRQAIHAAFSRAFERQADSMAATVVGRDAVLAALEHLPESGTQDYCSFDFWRTHPHPQRRRARLMESSVK
jgi:Zn-dependent protease with chaperone function